MTTCASKSAHARAAASTLRSLEMAAQSRDGSSVVPARAGGRAASARRRASWMCLAGSTRHRASGTATCAANRGRGPSSVDVVSLRNVPQCRAASSSSVEPPPSSSSPLAGGGGRGAKVHLRRCRRLVLDCRGTRSSTLHSPLPSSASSRCVVPRTHAAPAAVTSSSRGGAGVAATYEGPPKARTQRRKEAAGSMSKRLTRGFAWVEGARRRSLAPRLSKHLCGRRRKWACRLRKAARWHQLNIDECALLCGRRLPTEPRTTTARSHSRRNTIFIAERRRRAAGQAPRGL
jgi:hypothetical protein